MGVEDPVESLPPPPSLAVRKRITDILILVEQNIDAHIELPNSCQLVTDERWQAGS